MANAAARDKSVIELLETGLWLAHNHAMPDNLLYYYYGDNFDVLRRHGKDESVDLVYLDPPFKSNHDYNVLFAERDGTRAAAQIKAAEDVPLVCHAQSLRSMRFYRMPCPSRTQRALHELLEGRSIELPPRHEVTFNKAPKATKGEQFETKELVLGPKGDESQPADLHL